MFSEAKVTEIYCMADDFCKEFALRQEKYMVEDKNLNHHIGDEPGFLFINFIQKKRKE